ncbi:hypothetical protein TrST_g5124 [Triparma strigata]|uniref:YDG domain-containing protein n=1 Tax=Triparma strigata TaxID=1606541 RepID=A0A9W7BB37_9STRA|nr:hypothetical protein TrST_g5124 [Triparma strigata]
MLSSTARQYPSLGYSYHGVKMRTLPIDLVPEFETLARDFATSFSLPNNIWSIGVDLVVYRDGKDSIGWHADDTQNESCVLAVVIESEGERPVCIRPSKKARALMDGDEEVELYVKEGDGYELDAGCQAGYEHSLPKKRDVKARRMIAIFRQGTVKEVEADTGSPCCVKEYRRLGLIPPSAADGDEEDEKEGGLGLTMKRETTLVSSRVPPTIEAPSKHPPPPPAVILPPPGTPEKPPFSPTAQIVTPSPQKIKRFFNPALQPRHDLAKVSFGRPNPKSTSITEGSICSRNTIFQAQLHNSDQRGVSGNIELGADAVVVARNDGRVRERDGFTWMRYTSARKQGGGGMATTFNKQNPVRVFRSSAVESEFAPINPIKKSSGHNTSIYRYDGLYTIVKMIDNDGNDTCNIPDLEDDNVMPQNTFFMERNPTELEVEEWRLREELPPETPFRLGPAIVPKEYYNLKTAEELWVEIQESRNVPLEERGAIPYVDPKFDMEITRFKITQDNPRSHKNPVVAALDDIIGTIQFRDSLMTSPNINKAQPEAGTFEWIKKKKVLWRGQVVESKISGERTHVVRANVAHVLEKIVRKVADDEVGPLYEDDDDASEFDLRANYDIEVNFNSWLRKRKRGWRQHYRDSLMQEETWDSVGNFTPYEDDTVYTLRPTFATPEQLNLGTTKINKIYTQRLLSKTGSVADNRKRAVVSVTVGGNVMLGVRLMTTEAIEMSREFEQNLRKHGPKQVKSLLGGDEGQKAPPTRSTCEVVEVGQGGIRVVKHKVRDGREKLATINIYDQGLAWYHYDFDTQEMIDLGKRSWRPILGDILSVKGLQVPVQITPNGYGPAYKCEVIEEGEEKGDEGEREEEEEEVESGEEQGEEGGDGKATRTTTTTKTKTKKKFSVKVVEGSDSIGEIYTFDRWTNVWCFDNRERHGAVIAGDVLWVCWERGEEDEEDSDEKTQGKPRISRVYQNLVDEGWVITRGGGDNRIKRVVSPTGSVFRNFSHAGINVKGKAEGAEKIKRVVTGGTYLDHVIQVLSENKGAVGFPNLANSVSKIRGQENDKGLKKSLKNALKKGIEENIVDKVGASYKLNRAWVKKSKRKKIPKARETKIVVKKEDGGVKEEKKKRKREPQRVEKEEVEEYSSKNSHLYSWPSVGEGYTIRVVGCYRAAVVKRVNKKLGMIYLEATTYEPWKTSMSILDWSDSVKETGAVSSSGRKKKKNSKFV